MSDIFDEYCRISIKQGIVKEAETKAMTRVDKENSKEYRDTIMALYGLDIDSPNKGSILDQAHPDSLIIAPAYDRVNGLVENLQERHDIMVGICNKPTTGNLTHHRYAKKELLDELISLGFKLDNTREDALCVLADKCSIKLTNEMQKEAVFKKEAWAWLTALAPKALPWVIKGLTAASVWGGIKGQMIGHFNKDFVSALTEAEKSLESLLSVVVGEDKPKVKELQGILRVLRSKSKAAYEILSNNQAAVNTIDDVKGVSDARKKMELTQAEAKTLEEYLDLVSFIIDHIGERVSLDQLDQLMGSGGTSYTSAIANMNEVSDSSDTMKMLEGLWSSTLGEIVSPESDEKKYAINAFYNLRDALSKFYENNKNRISDGVAEVEEQEAALMSQVEDAKKNKQKSSGEESSGPGDFYDFDEG